jgi:plasmid stabilization system protein ParE
MTGSQHFRRAEQLAEQAYRHLGQDGEETAASAWSALAQVHATLALAAAAGVAPEHRAQLAAGPVSRRQT